MSLQPRPISYVLWALLISPNTRWPLAHACSTIGTTDSTVDSLNRSHACVPFCRRGFSLLIPLLLLSPGALRVGCSRPRSALAAAPAPADSDDEAPIPRFSHRPALIFCYGYAEVPLLRPNVSRLYSSPAFVCPRPASQPTGRGTFPFEDGDYQLIINLGKWRKDEKEKGAEEEPHHHSHTKSEHQSE
jgi:hypothetical protein